MNYHTNYKSNPKYESFIQRTMITELVYFGHVLKEHINLRIHNSQVEVLSVNWF